MRTDADALRLPAPPHGGGGVNWPPVGGAFAASTVIHALAITAIGAILARAPLPAAPASAVSIPIEALIVSEKAPEAPPPVPILVAKAPSPAPKVRAPLPIATPREPPWSTAPRNPDPPASFLEPPALAEGVAFVENRNVVALGGEIERRINTDYPGDPRYPVVLNPPEVLGYPLDLLSRGVEGRVLVWFGVDELGNIVDREYLDGPPELAEWVMPRLDRLVDKPARDESKPVRGWVALEIDFSRDAAEAARAAREVEEGRRKRDEQRAASSK